MNKLWDETMNLNISLEQLGKKMNQFDPKSLLVT